nr:L10-interacting MYB domain-containing protein-like [Tanacetum cinerariifolium]
MAWQTDYCIMKEGMPILRGRKSVPGMNSSEREMERRCFENDENANGGKKEDDICAYIEKLDKVGWAAQDPMYDTTLLLFGQSADYRKLWLHLKPKGCRNWVKSVGSNPIFTTASVVTPYSRCKGKEKKVDLDTPKKKKVQEQIDVQVAREMEEQMAREDQRRNEQIARDAKIARIHAEEELKIMIDGLDRNNEVVARHLHEYEQAAAELTIGEKIELINDLVKTSEEVSKEDLKEMMQLVPVEEVYVEALQVKHPIIDWEIHTEGQRNYW